MIGWSKCLIGSHDLLYSRYGNFAICARCGKIYDNGSNNYEKDKLEH